MTTISDPETRPAPPSLLAGIWVPVWSVIRHLARSPFTGAALAVLLIYAALAIFAPMFISDVSAINPVDRLKPPGTDGHILGTDHLGRPLDKLVLVGARTSLSIGLLVAVVVTVFGVAIGLVGGYFKWGERLLMRLMDGMMAIPSLLLAIALVAVLGPGFLTIVVAISVNDTPRMARIVRGVVISVKNQPFVDAARTIGTPTWKILLRHILPNTVGAVTVQATYVAASAILLEAILSFLGAGMPPHIPSWGSMIAQGRYLFQIAPWTIMIPGAMLTLLVLSINILGDALRELLDPRVKERGGYAKR